MNFGWVVFLCVEFAFVRYYPVAGCILNASVVACVFFLLPLLWKTYLKIMTTLSLKVICFEIFNTCACLSGKVSDIPFVMKRVSHLLTIITTHGYSNYCFICFEQLSPMGESKNGGQRTGSDDQNQKYDCPDEIHNFHSSCSEGRVCCPICRAGVAGDDKEETQDSNDCGGETMYQSSTYKEID
jgi:hypothetical protein